MPETSTFPDTYLRFLPAVRAKCRRMLGETSEAEDVANESFVRLWQSGPSADDLTATRSVMAWLYRTSTRLCVDTLRKRRHVAFDEHDEHLPCGAPLEQAVHAKRMIFDLVAHVPADEVEAALLCRVDGLSHPEAAEVLGISERTVRRLLERFDAHTHEWRKENAS